MWNTLWYQVKKIVPGLLFMVGIIAVIRIFHLKVLGIIAVILISQLAYTGALIFLKKQALDVRRVVKNMVISIIVLAVVIFCLKYLVVKLGLLGFALFIIGWSVYRLIRGRKQYVDAMRQIEMIR